MVSVSFDSNLVQLIAIIAPIISTIVLGVLAYYTNKANINAVQAAHNADNNANRASVATERVRQTLVDTNDETKQKLNSIAETTDKTHTLVNSNYGIALMSTLLALRDVAKLTTNPADKKTADEAVVAAERLYADHQRKQGIVDTAAAAAADDNDPSVE